MEPDSSREDVGTAIN